MQEFEIIDALPCSSTWSAVFSKDSRKRKRLCKPLVQDVHKYGLLLSNFNSEPHIYALMCRSILHSAGFQKWPLRDVHFPLAKSTPINDFFVAEAGKVKRLSGLCTDSFMLPGSSGLSDSDSLKQCSAKFPDGVLIWDVCSSRTPVFSHSVQFRPPPDSLVKTIYDKVILVKSNICEVSCDYGKAIPCQLDIFEALGSLMVVNCDGTRLESQQVKGDTKLRIVEPNSTALLREQSLREFSLACGLARHLEGIADSVLQMVFDFTKRISVSMRSSSNEITDIDRLFLQYKDLGGLSWEHILLACQLHCDQLVFSNKCALNVCDSLPAIGFSPAAMSRIQYRLLRINSESYIPAQCRDINRFNRRKRYVIHRK